MSRPDAILIAGPTASGKSQLALDVGRRFGGEIINTDSMQVYDGLRVLTARPSKDDENQVAHHLYGHVAPAESFSVAKWLEQAAESARDIRSRDCVPVFVGGTGLYFKALENGLANVPEIPPDLRQSIRQALIKNGSEALHARLALVDSATAARVRPGDGQRIARALEVVEATGRSLKSYQDAAQSDSLLNGLQVEKVILMPDRPTLHGRINLRAQKMMEQGAIDEVRALLTLGLPSAATIMQAIGVRQLAAFLADEIALQDAVEKIQAATRQYAKRQSTWFRGQHGAEWQLFENAEDAQNHFSC